jgi:chromate transporter
MNPTPEPAVASAPAGRQDAVPLAEAFRVWLKVAILSFGGPVAQIAVMHRIIVDEKRWVGEERFLHALNYCMLLPGPEAQQLATYIGWLLNRAVGGLIAGTLFVLPGALVMLGLSVLYAGYQEVTIVQAIFFGIKAAVLAVVIEAVLRIGRRALKTRAMVVVAAVAFVAIFFLEVPFPLIVLAAGIVGYVGGRHRPAAFVVAGGHGAKAGAAMRPPVIDESRLYEVRPTLGRAVGVLAIWLTLWWGPVVAIVAAVGWDDVFTQIAIFFSKMAVVTFGGAYAVLAYVAQQAVEHYGWLAPGEMLDGLGMAETTPGPLILVTQFVGFLGAFREPGALDPMLAGTLGAVLTTWVTFTPCFLWIFLGAPYVETLRGNRALSAALATITAAIVGVVLNLAVWFAFHVVFAKVADVHVGPVKLLIPEWATLDLASLALAGAALVAMLRFKIGMMTTLAASAALGATWFLATT